MRNGVELFFCQECEDTNRNPVVVLDRGLRCGQCGSDAVVSVERLLLAQHKSVPAVKKPFLLLARMV